MSKIELYSTPDLYLGAYLRLKGYKISLDRDKNKVLFKFEKTDELTKCVEDYFMNTGSCDPLEYTNSIKNLKNLIYNKK